MRPALILAVMTALAGCEQFPEVDAARAGREDAPPPPLLPLDELLAQAGTPTVSPETEAALEARAAALRVRAAALQAAPAAP
ncbi:hypothetical protein LV780_03455 [Cereibacter azotoformans]|uniref:Uncharacterized protein n=1 Tax=Cereibacter azotoformans TaxID=43057 RepID=A0A2T5JWI5_9RHOB|nr:hypothetical protein [Cereibacter azotoformans]AXQ92955.1 hypothetical protein D0Z66_03445 [Cereibacter sphaeroides]MBO4169366.1 hypothetical protein [Cereibacter azotoformans]PTR14534.1 hypothetical protein C8J28_1165 [Cereibacter azotoformans]UIJ31248.1 hypothetical protein LV780_03455 [Cereibacter azotoformans]